MAQSQELGGLPSFRRHKDGSNKDCKQTVFWSHPGIGLAHARGHRNPGFCPQCAGGGVRPEFRALSPLHALPGRLGRAAGTPDTHCACAGVVTTAPGRTRSARVREEKPRGTRRPARPRPVGQGNPSPAALRTGGGAGETAQTGWGLLRRGRGREQA